MTTIMRSGAIVIGCLLHITVTAAEIRPDTAKALQDWSAGKPLEGLPNLKKPVYLKGETLLCQSSGALMNPNVPVLLLTRACMVMPKRVRVLVYPPADAQSYMEGYMYQMVRVSLTTGDISNGNSTQGWVFLDSLTN